jgi:acyl-CoA oxidase
MSTRLAEIKMEHELNDLDFATMVEAIDDTLPVSSFNGLCHENKLLAPHFNWS